MKSFSLGSESRAIRFLSVCFSLALSLSMSLPAWSDSDADDAKSTRVTARIIGGQDAPQNYPWMTSLQVRGGTGYEHICGGVLVEASTVLTAAHCVADLPRDHLRLVIGRQDISFVPASALRRVAEIIVHPSYHRDTFDNDIAVIRLRDPVRDVQPLALPDVPQGALASGQTLDDISGEVVLPGVYGNPVLTGAGIEHRILGWGATSAQLNSESAEQLQAADLTVFSEALCRGSGSLNQTTFCAGELDGSVDSCLGDSGGPLIRVTTPSIGQPTGGVELMGLVSYGNGTQCGKAGVYGFYTDTQKFLAFINGVVAGRDHWVPFKWVGLNFPSRTDVTINNYTNRIQYFGLLSGTYPNGVQLQGNNCEQAQLSLGQGCSLDYEITPSALGSQIISTSVSYVTTTEFGDWENAEKRILGQVNVIPPLNVSAAFESGNSQWFTGGDGAWGADFTSYAAGGAALRSSALRDNQSSVLQAFVPGPTVLEAYVMVDSERNFDYLVVTVNEQERYRDSGYSGWERLTISIPPEGATVRFEYVKDGSDGPDALGRRDAAWVDIVGLGDVREQVVLVDDDDRQLLGGTPNPNIGGQDVDGGAVSGKGLLLVLLLGLGRLTACLRWSGLRGGVRLMNALMGFNRIRLSKKLKWMCLSLVVSGLSLGCAGNDAESPDPGKSQVSQTVIQPISSSSSSAASNKKPVPSAKTTFVAEPLYSKRFVHKHLVIQVRSHGCTQASSFEIVKAKDKPAGWYTVGRVKPDYCRRAPMIITVTLPLPAYILREILDSNHPEQMLLTNIEVPSVGLPVIPAAGAP